MTKHKEVLELALDTHIKNESHRTVEESRYWCDQYKMLAQTAIKALAHPAQEPVVLRFSEWTVSKNDLSDHICVGELTLAGIEDNLEGPEFGEVEIERFDAVIEALQEKLVTGRECKKVPLIAYIGANNTTPPQRKPLTDEQADKILETAEKINPNYVGWVRDQRRAYVRAGYNAANGIKGDA